MTKHSPRTHPLAAISSARSRSVGARQHVERCRVRAEYVSRGLDCVARPDYPSVQILHMVAERILANGDAAGQLPRP